MVVFPMALPRRAILHIERVLWKQETGNRCFVRPIEKQDPEEIESMPIFQYATENTKKSSRIYMWGSTICGELGKASFIIPGSYKRVLQTMHKPWRHPFADKHKIQDIACGYGFTVIAGSNKDTNHSLFGTGLNTDGQLGHQLSKRNKPLEIIAEPVPILLPLLNSSTKVTYIACGRAHTIVVTDKEGTFSLGNNAYGQCGSSSSASEDKHHIFRVNKVEGIDEEISKVVCGQDHTLFLLKSGKVYSCGWSADGQTGLGHYKNQHTPSKVIGDIEGEKIIQLSCAADCALALSDQGEVFGWGNSEYGQLNSVTDKQQINISRKLKLNVGKVKSITSGGTMCGVLADDGRVYVWGYGILGLGPNVSSHKEPTMIPPPLFGYNEFSTDVSVDQISSNLSHFAAITNKGHLYMWGRNRENCLGLGRFEDQYFPFRVAVPAEVLKVTCGVNHTAAICKSFS